MNRELAKAIDNLPFFVSTQRLARFARRDILTVRRWFDRLPPRIALTEKNKGWMKPVIVKWLKQNPEFIRQD